MSKEHDLLKSYAKLILRDMGYRESEIHEEYTLRHPGMKQVLRVDVVGIKDRSWNDIRSTAIECGQCEAQKIAWLKLYFDDVIHLPFLQLAEGLDTPNSVKSLIEMRLSDYQTQRMKELQDKVEKLQRKNEELEKLAELNEAKMKRVFEERLLELGKRVIVSLASINALPHQIMHYGSPDLLSEWKKEFVLEDSKQQIINDNNITLGLSALENAQV